MIRNSRRPTAPGRMDRTAPAGGGQPARTGPPCGGRRRLDAACSSERLVFNKLLTGALRVGVSHDWCSRRWPSGPAWTSHASPSACSASGCPRPDCWLSCCHRTSCRWTGNSPTRSSSPRHWKASLRSASADRRLAAGMEMGWHPSAALRRRGEVALWSRGEERLDGRFPEIEQAAMALPDGCVLDGELLAWDEAANLPRAFTALQTRIQRRKPGARPCATRRCACWPMTCWNRMALTCVSCPAGAAHPARQRHRCAGGCADPAVARGCR